MIITLPKELQGICDGTRTDVSAEVRASFREFCDQCEANGGLDLATRRIQKLPPQIRQQARTRRLHVPGGVGTELKSLLKWFGQYPSGECNCIKHALAMDINGIEWCKSNVEVIVGWMRTEAATRKVLGLSIDRMPGFAHLARGRVLKAISNAERKCASATQQSFPAINRNKLVKHLLSHILPVVGKSEWVWKRHCERLKANVHRFNGRKLIAVATPGHNDRFTMREGKPAFSLRSVDAVREILGDEFEIFPMVNAGTGEVVSFVPLLEKILTDDPNHVFIWTHAKGVSHGQNTDHPSHRWTDLLWETVFENDERAIEALDSRAVAGSFVMDGHAGHRVRGVGQPKFLFAGTFFWGRCCEVWQVDWRKIARNYGGVEMWPGLHFGREKIACLFLDQTTDPRPWTHPGPKGCLYIPEYLSGEVEESIQSWRKNGRPFELLSDQKMPAVVTRHKWQYKSYAEVIEDTHAWCDRLPPISAVCGVPRSGAMLAALIAQRRNVPLLSLDSLRESKPSWRRPGRKQRDVAGPILLVDDTSFSGNSMRDYREMFKTRTDMLYGALYAKNQAVMSVDVWGFDLTTPLHTFEYNVLREGLTPNYVCDLDGVFRKDFHDHPGGEETHEAEYRYWLRNGAATHLLPTYPVAAIVTASLGKFRDLTEAWLKDHGIQYGELIQPFYSLADRIGQDVAAIKAQHYQRFSKATLFVESEASQASEIHRLTGRPVFCTDSMTMIQRD